MEIKEKKLKEVNEVVGYKCDICDCSIDIDMFFANIHLNTVKYNVPSGVWGESTANIINHVCSVKCLKKALNGAAFGANVFLSRELIEELLK